AIALEYRDFGNAAIQYESILKEKPDEHAAKLGLAVAYKGLGRFKDAETIYVKLLKEDPSDLAAVWNSAVLFHRHLNRYDDAIAMYKKADELAPKGDKIHKNVPRLIKKVKIVKNDIAARLAREEKERKQREGSEAACKAVAAGKKPDRDAIGGEQEIIEVAWQLWGKGEQDLQAGAMDTGEAWINCAMAVVPDTKRGRIDVCIPMRINWTQTLYALGRLQEGLESIQVARKCDPENADAQLIEEQLVGLVAEQKAMEEAMAAEAAAQEAADKAAAAEAVAAEAAAVEAAAVEAAKPKGLAIEGEGSDKKKDVKDKKKEAKTKSSASKSSKKKGK
ncbi:tetratricopeptide repeat protein, partial [Myxococcota bacterium]|nr:tetratricopeptide repeat protein [Myxococcota bacterium]